VATAFVLERGLDLRMHDPARGPIDGPQCLIEISHRPGHNYRTTINVRLRTAMLNPFNNFQQLLAIAPADCDRLHLQVIQRFLGRLPYHGILLNRVWRSRIIEPKVSFELETAATTPVVAEQLIGEFVG
jgi:hypothetical protein